MSSSCLGYTRDFGISRGFEALRDFWSSAFGDFRDLRVLGGSLGCRV